MVAVETTLIKKGHCQRYEWRNTLSIQINKLAIASGILMISVTIDYAPIMLFTLFFKDNCSKLR